MCGIIRAGVRSAIRQPAAGEIPREVRTLGLPKVQDFLVRILLPAHGARSKRVGPSLGVVPSPPANPPSDQRAPRRVRQIIAGRLASRISAGARVGVTGRLRSTALRPLHAMRTLAGFAVGACALARGRGDWSSNKSLLRESQSAWSTCISARENRINTTDSSAKAAPVAMAIFQPSAAAMADKARAFTNPIMLAPVLNRP